jgi:hypothetical protein
MHPVDLRDPSSVNQFLHPLDRATTSEDRTASIRRFTRRTNACSKTIESQAAMVDLYYMEVEA